MSKHAQVKVGDYIIPLIGVPKDAGLEECDLCHKYFPLWEIHVKDEQFLCDKCNEPPTPTN